MRAELRRGSRAPRGSNGAPGTKSLSPLVLIWSVTHSAFWNRTSTSADAICQLELEEPTYQRGPSGARQRASCGPARAEDRSTARLDRAREPRRSSLCVGQRGDWPACRRAAKLLKKAARARTAPLFFFRDRALDGCPPSALPQGLPRALTAAELASALARADCIPR